MPDPNEAMGVEEILARFRVGADDYFSKDIRYGRTADETIEAINEYVAQQNAALLRELSKRQVTLHAGKRGQYKPVQAIPASILEAKLNELDTNKEVI